MAEAPSTSELFPFGPVDTKDNPIPADWVKSQNGKYKQSASLQNSWPAVQADFLLLWPHPAGSMGGKAEEGVV